MVIDFAECGVEAYLYTCPFMRLVYNGVLLYLQSYVSVFLFICV